MELIPKIEIPVQIAEYIVSILVINNIMKRSRIMDACLHNLKGPVKSFFKEKKSISIFSNTLVCNEITYFSVC